MFSLVPGLTEGLIANIEEGEEGACGAGFSLSTSWTILLAALEALGRLDGRPRPTAAGAGVGFSEGFSEAFSAGISASFSAGFSASLTVCPPKEKPPKGVELAMGTVGLKPPVDEADDEVDAGKVNEPTLGGPATIAGFGSGRLFLGAGASTVSSAFDCGMPASFLKSATRFSYSPFKEIMAAAKSTNGSSRSLTLSARIRDSLRPRMFFK